MQDLAALSGRCLGFDVSFATSPPLGVPARLHAFWRSARGVLFVAVPTAHLPWPTARDLARAAEEHRTSLGITGPRLEALIIVPPYVAIPDETPSDVAAPEGATPEPVVPIRVTIVGLAALMSLADLAGSGRMSHADVVELLETGTRIDGVVGVLERTAAAARATSAEPEPHEAVSAEGMPVQPRTGYWLSSVVPDQAMTPEEFLEVVVARRHVFGISDETGAGPGSVRAGDSVCFYIGRKGVVGHARVASTLESGGGSLRDARRFRQVLRLERIQLHVGAPVPLDPETELRVRRLPPVTIGRHAQVLVAISATSYQELTSTPPAEGPTVVPFDLGERSEPASDLVPDASAADGGEHDRNVL